MLHILTLLVQICVILIVARIIGRIFHVFHQPQVLGEMVAGILLGPSLLGWLMPSISSALFPPDSFVFLNALSQIGLLLFMFLIGLELDPQILQERRHVVVFTSQVSIIVPFLLGTVLARYLYPRLSDERVPFIHFALFVGTAMSITAFPVLARILTQLNLLRTHLGTVALACAAANDITAWCILAGVVLLVRTTDGALPFWFMLFAVVIYVGIMGFGMRRALRQIGVSYRRHLAISQDMLALILLLVLVSASVTEALGIHALFGAFLMGTVMPKDPQFVLALREKIEGLAVVLLLPLFFVLTGLRTSIGLVHGTEMWFYCGLITAVAVAGKFGGSTLSARMTGMSWRESGALGILMNTRGLIELVVLNIGLDIGVISPTLFTMMVIMALATTFLTTPLLDWILSYPATSA
jgi:Kef-type K+ transport system membrane component KefB